MPKVPQSRELRPRLSIVDVLTDDELAVYVEAVRALLASAMTNIRASGQSVQDVLDAQRAER